MLNFVKRARKCRETRSICVTPHDGALALPHTKLAAMFLFHHLVEKSMSGKWRRIIRCVECVLDSWMFESDAWDIFSRAFGEFEWFVREFGRLF